MDEKILLIAILFVVVLVYKRWAFGRKRKRRRNYYRNVYLKSDDWRRKRYVVLKRDNWQCVYCGERATQVHHKRYAKRNIGKEPIKWLVSVCKSCHDSMHN
jgi:5-methylcytosine-specific restriction endonuclease McrA